jgi:SAM-dependent methyltransferase
MPTYTRDRCPLCESVEHRVLGALDRNGAVLAPPADSAIVSCRACALVYVNPMPHWHADEFELLYGNGYFGNVDPAWEAKRSTEIPGYRLRIITRLIRCEGRTALEIGSGDSAFMARFLVSRGWQVDAQEPSAVFVKKLRTVDPRINVLDQPFLSLVPTRRYSLIYADSVLEHVPEPNPYFEKIAELLEPGGLLYFVSPNEYSLGNVLATLRNKFGNGNARMLCPYTGSYHLLGYSKRAVELVGQRVGLRLVRFARERDFEWWHVLRRDPRSPRRYAHSAAAFVANALGLGTNLEIAMRRDLTSFHTGRQ